MFSRNQKVEIHNHNYIGFPPPADEPSKARGGFGAFVGFLAVAGVALTAVGAVGYLAVNVVANVASSVDGQTVLLVAGAGITAWLLWKFRHLGAVQPVTMPNPWPALRVVLGIVTAPVWIPAMLVWEGVMWLTEAIANRRSDVQRVTTVNEAQGILVDWPVRKETVGK